MIESGAEINCITKDSQNVLHYSCIYNSNFARYFLEKGVDPNLLSFYTKKSPFGEFVKYLNTSDYKLDVVFSFLLHGANPHLAASSYYQNLNQTIYETLSKIPQLSDLLQNFENGNIWNASFHSFFPSSFRLVVYSFVVCLKVSAISIPKPLFKYIFDFLVITSFPKIFSNLPKKIKEENEIN